MLPRTVGVDVRVIVGRIAVSASQCQCHDGLAAMVVGPGGRASGKRNVRGFATHVRASWHHGMIGDGVRMMSARPGMRWDGHTGRW